MYGDQTAAAVRMHGVHKAFGEGHTRLDVLKGIDLGIRLGELFMLVGPSGSGKSTLLCVMTGLLESDAGQIEVLGQRMDQMTSQEKTVFRRDNVGFVFQQYLLLPTLSALENAAVPLFNRGMPRRQALSMAGRWLEEIGLGARMHAPPSELSGGEQQRVAVARALVTEPRLLVCDEPTANLDGETGLKVMEVLRERALRPDRTLLVVTHDSRNYRFGSRIAQMLDGRIEQVHEITQEDRARLMQEPAGWPWQERST